MTDIRKIPLEIPLNWKEVLNLLQKTFPNALIVGGAPRDLYFKVEEEIRDIDIFITKKIKDTQYAKEIVKALFNTEEMWQTASNTKEEPFGKTVTTDFAIPQSRQHKFLQNKVRTITVYIEKYNEQFHHFEFWATYGQMYQISFKKEDVSVEWYLNSSNLNVSQITYDGADTWAGKDFPKGSICTEIFIRPEGMRGDFHRKSSGIKAFQLTSRPHFKSARVIDLTINDITILNN